VSLHFPFWRSSAPHLLCRLLDLSDDGALLLTAIRVVTLDECDKMLSLGFAPQLQRLASLILEPPAPPLETPLATLPSNSALQTTICSKKGKKRAQSDDALLVPMQTVLSVASDQPFERPQVLLFSATMPVGWDKSAGGWVAPGALRVDISSSAAASMSSKVTQVSMLKC
jgi:superfamily II DNA/RNA helicase